MTDEGAEVLAPPAETQDSTAESSQKPQNKPKQPRNWEKLLQQAQKDLSRNNSIIENAAPSGVASDPTLRTRGYESLPAIKVKQPLVKR